MEKIRFHNDILPLKDKIFRLALRITLRREVAEDITQETLVRVWERRGEWDTIENMEVYCLTIGRRLAIDHLRQRQQQTEREGEITDYHLSAASTDRMADEVLDQKQRVAQVMELIEQLPEMQRTIIEMRDIEGLKYDEIAQVTGLNETQVKVYLHRARKKIRESL